MEPKLLIATAVVAALVMFVTTFLIGLSMRLDVVASLPEVWECPALDASAPAGC
jgi:hypothetical protein